jgi:hypothetical protein
MKTLKQLDKAEVTDVDIDIAAKFTVENNQNILSSINVRPHTAKGVIGLRDIMKSKLTIEDDKSVVVRDKVITSVSYEKPKVVCFFI